MTPKEAIKALEYINLKRVHPFYDWEEMKEVRDIAIEALEKQISKKVKKEILTSNAFTQWRKYNCPNCGCFLYSGSSKPFSAQPHCYRCGQALDWGEEE